MGSLVLQDQDEDIHGHTQKNLKKQQAESGLHHTSLMTTLTKVSIFKNSEEIRIEITLLGSVTNKHHMTKRRPAQNTQPVTNDAAQGHGRQLLLTLTETWFVLVLSC